MCTTSMIYDHGYQHKPWDAPAPAPYWNQQPFPDREAAEAIKRFLKLLDAAKEYDKATGQPDCEDPKKAAFMTEVLDRLAAIEKRLAQADTK
jgi:hypothetical protein